VKHIFPQWGYENEWGRHGNGKWDPISGFRNYFSMGVLDEDHTGRIDRLVRNVFFWSVRSPVHGGADSSGGCFVDSVFKNTA